MRVGIVTGILHHKYGGPAAVVKAHAAVLAERFDVQLYGVADKSEFNDISTELPGARLFPTAWPQRWFRGSGLAVALEQDASQLDAIHAHMLWDHAVLASWRVARKAGIPLFLTPHGSTLTDDRLSAVYKRVYLRSFLTPVLRGAACIQALSTREEEALRRVGATAPIRVIPNGLAKCQYGVRTPPDLSQRIWPSIVGRRVLLFLGRLWHEKGLDILLRAWKRVSSQSASRDWLLVIAGPDYRGYTSQLRRDIETLGLSRSILVTGSVTGPLKHSLMCASEVFVMPSHGEAFSMSLLESMAAMVPSVYTKNCGLPELALSGGGWECDDTTEGLADTLGNIIGQSSHALSEAGKNAMRLGYTCFTLEAVGNKLASMYTDFGWGITPSS